VTRSTTALQSDGTTLISFTNANVALSGTPVNGETWTIRVAGTDYAFSVDASQSLDQVAIGLRNKINQTGSRASINGATPTVVSIADADGFTLAFSVAGVAPTGAATLSGAPVQGGTPAQTEAILWTQANIAFPTARPGEKWTITLDGGSGAPVVVDYTLGSTDSSSKLADELGKLIAAKGYTASHDNAILIVGGSTAFTTKIDVTPSGGTTAGPTVFTHSVTINSAFAAANQWTIFLTETGGAAITGGIKSVAGSTDTKVVASNLAAAINGVTGFHAVAEAGTSTLTITRTTGADFNLALAINSPSQVSTDSTTVARVVTIPDTVVSTDTLVLTVGTGIYTKTGFADADAYAHEFAVSVNNSSGFTARSSGSSITIVALAATTFNASLTIDNNAVSTDQVNFIRDDAGRPHRAHGRDALVGRRLRRQPDGSRHQQLAGEQRHDVDRERQQHHDRARDREHPHCHAGDDQHRLLPGDVELWHELHDDDELHPAHGPCRLGDEHDLRRERDDHRVRRQQQQRHVHRRRSRRRHLHGRRGGRHEDRGRDDLEARVGDVQPPAAGPARRRR